MDYNIFEIKKKLEKRTAIWVCIVIIIKKILVRAENRPVEVMLPTHL